MTSPTPFELLGGADAIRAIVDRFYDLMDTAPEAAAIRALHARSLKVSREKLTKYLTGWTGGPPLYEQEYGHPRLRMRHLPFPIGTAERDAWLRCMQQALAEQVPDAALRAGVTHAFVQMADHMRNQAPPGAGPHG